MHNDHNFFYSQLNRRFFCVRGVTPSSSMQKDDEREADEKRANDLIGGGMRVKGN
jgi:hypothetical protein